MELNTLTTLLCESVTQLLQNTDETYWYWGFLKIYSRFSSDMGPDGVGKFSSRWPASGGARGSKVTSLFTFMYSEVQQVQIPANFKVHKHVYFYNH